MSDSEHGRAAGCWCQSVSSVQMNVTMTAKTATRIKRFDRPPNTSPPLHNGPPFGVNHEVSRQHNGLGALLGSKHQCLGRILQSYPQRQPSERKRERYLNSQAREHEASLALPLITSINSTSSQDLLTQMNPREGRPPNDFFDRLP